MERGLETQKVYRTHRVNKLLTDRSLMLQIVFLPREVVVKQWIMIFLVMSLLFQRVTSQISCIRKDINMTHKSTKIITMQ